MSLRLLSKGFNWDICRGVSIGWMYLNYCPSDNALFKSGQKWPQILMSLFYSRFSLYIPDILWESYLHTILNVDW